MRRRELLAGAGSAALAALAGCSTGDYGEVKVIEGGEHLQDVSTDSHMLSPLVTLNITVSQWVRTRCDYVVAVRDGTQRDVYELGSGEVDAELIVRGGTFTLLFIRGGETFNRGGLTRHRDGQVIAHSTVVITGVV